MNPEPLRYFCPSCHQRRVVSFAQWVEQEVLEKVPHRQYVFTIPKCLRIYFKYDRELLGDLCRCAYESLKEFFQAALPDKESTPGAIIAIQSFGEMLNFHPHLHCLVTDGCFGQEGTFYQLPSLVDLGLLSGLFRHKLLRMLLPRGKITGAMVDNLLSWPHSGFHVHQGGRIESGDKAGAERVASYILRAPLSQQMLVYLKEKEQVIYSCGKKKGADKKVFTALDWLAALTAHIPNRGEQMVQ